MKGSSMAGGVTKRKGYQGILFQCFESFDPPSWVPKAMRKTCKFCKIPLRTRHSHNCRICGHVYCSLCTKKYEVPDRFRRKGKDGPVRVCLTCRNIALERHSLSEGVVIGPRPRQILSQSVTSGLIYIHPPDWAEPGDHPLCTDCENPSRFCDHCRLCGELFCGSCSSKEQVPDAFRKNSKHGYVCVCYECRHKMYGPDYKLSHFMTSGFRPKPRSVDRIQTAPTISKSDLEDQEFQEFDPESSDRPRSNSVYAKMEEKKRQQTAAKNKNKKHTKSQSLSLPSTTDFYHKPQRSVSKGLHISPPQSPPQSPRHSPPQSPSNSRRKPPPWFQRQASDKKPKKSRSVSPRYKSPKKMPVRALTQQFENGFSEPPPKSPSKSKKQSSKAHSKTKSLNLTMPSYISKNISKFKDKPTSPKPNPFRSRGYSGTYPPNPKPLKKIWPPPGNTGKTKTPRKKPGHRSLNSLKNGLFSQTSDEKPKLKKQNSFASRFRRDSSILERNALRQQNPKFKNLFSFWEADPTNPAQKRPTINGMLGLVSSTLDDKLQLDGQKTDDNIETSLELQLGDMVQHCSVERLCMDMSVFGCTLAHLYEVCLPYVISDLINVLTSRLVHADVDQTVNFMQNSGYVEHPALEELRTADDALTFFTKMSTAELEKGEVYSVPESLTFYHPFEYGKPRIEKMKVEHIFNSNARPILLSVIHARGAQTPGIASPVNRNRRAQNARVQRRGPPNSSKHIRSKLENLSKTSSASNPSSNRSFEQNSTSGTGGGFGTSRSEGFSDFGFSSSTSTYSSSSSGFSSNTSSLRLPLSSSNISTPSTDFSPVSSPGPSSREPSPSLSDDEQASDMELKKDFDFQQISSDDLERDLELRTSPIRIIFKCGDDLRQDVACLHIFRLMNQIWGHSKVKAHNYAVEARAYRCVSVTKDMGFVEMVQNCTTLKDFQLQQSPDPETIKRLVTSAAGSYVACFILGIRDRHADNILIDSLGNLFHIDFGYILGNNVSFDTARFAITRELKIAMGDKWLLFINLCVRAFQTLRTHKELVIRAIVMMLKPLIPASTIREFLRISFMTDRGEEEAVAEVRRLLTVAPDSYKTKFKNTLHSIATR